MADSVETGAYVALQNPWRGVLMRQHREALPNRIRCAWLDHASWAYQQYTTSISQPSLEYVTITHPHHPLHGQRCEVIFIRRGVDPDLILRLADGTHAAIAMSWTDSGKGEALAAAQSGPALPLLDLQGLRQLLHLWDQLRQEDRFPTPRRTPRARPARHTLPQGKH